MAQQNTTINNPNGTEDNRKMDLAVYVSGTESAASYACCMVTGSGNIKIITGTTNAGKNAAALTAINTMFADHIKAKNLAIGLTTNCKWLTEELKGGYRAKTPVERLAKYGKGNLDLFTTMINLLNGKQDHFEKNALPNEFAMTLAKAAAYYELHAVKAANEAAAIASSEEPLEAQEA